MSKSLKIKNKSIKQKEVLEKNIARNIMDFEHKTGFKVESVSITVKKGCRRNRYYEAKADIKL